jgi:hypothetical protein
VTTRGQNSPRCRSKRPRTADDAFPIQPPSSARGRSSASGRRRYAPSSLRSALHNAPLYHLPPRSSALRSSRPARSIRRAWLSGLRCTDHDFGCFRSPPSVFKTSIALRKSPQPFPRSRQIYFTVTQVQAAKWLTCVEMLPNKTPFKLVRPRLPMTIMSALVRMA